MDIVTHRFCKLLYFLAVLAIVVIAAHTEAAWAGDVSEVDRLVAALDQFDRWVGDGQNGDRWRRYLKSNQLRQLLEKDTQAEPAEVARILQRYRSDAHGLEMQPAVRVRSALAAWHVALKNQPADDLSELARASRGDYRPITDSQMGILHSAMRNAAEQLEQALSAYGPAFATDWKRYLKWELLEPQLSDETKITRRTLNHLDEVLKKFRANHPGLERTEFTRTAKALEQFRAVAPWTVTPKPRQEYDRLLTNLEGQLRRHKEAPTSETSWKIARVLGLIEQLNNSPQLIGAIRGKLNQTNLLAEVSENFINRAIRRPVDNTQPVRDNILGTSIRGTAHTLGSIAIRPIPSLMDAQFELLLSGNIFSSTWGHHHPVRIRSTGRTDFSATKRVLLSAEAFQSKPTVVTANTQSNIHSICKTGGQFGHRLIERIAWKKACKSKQCAEQIASRHAESKVASNFDEQLTEALGQARENYEQKIRDPLVRRDVYPAHFLLATEPHFIRMEVAFAKQSQLAADSLPPPVAVGSDITVRIHQSALNNYIPLAMSGVTIQQLTEGEEPRLIGDVPPWMSKLSLGKHLQKKSIQKNQDRPDFMPWSITLNAEQPVSIVFDNQQLVIRMRASMLTSDEDEYKNWDFIVTYDVLRQNNEILLRRSGEIEVFPTGFDPRWDKKMSSKKSGFRSTLAGNMNARAKRGDGFPAEIPIRAIRLPEQLGISGELKLQQLDCDAGWLTLGWALP